MVKPEIADAVKTEQNSESKVQIVSVQLAKKPKLKKEARCEASQKPAIQGMDAGPASGKLFFCPQGHALVEALHDGGVWKSGCHKGRKYFYKVTCDLCGVETDAATWSCSFCDWDTCGGCVQKLYQYNSS